MNPLLIDFEWAKHSGGYKLIPARARRPPTEGESLLAADYGDPESVVPNGGTLLPYRPLEKFDVLFKAFANLKTSDDVLGFIQKFGPITKRGLGHSREEVPRVLVLSGVFRALLLGAKDKKRLATDFDEEGIPDFVRLETALVPHGNRLRLVIKPQSLLAAMGLQLAVELAGGKRILTCQQCGIWFWAGVGTRRRLDAKFCSDPHRVQYNSG
jgi:hypothetical protein